MMITSEMFKLSYEELIIKKATLKLYYLRKTSAIKIARSYKKYLIHKKGKT